MGILLNFWGRLCLRGLQRLRGTDVTLLFDSKSATGELGLCVWSMLDMCLRVEATTVSLVLFKASATMLKLFRGRRAVLLSSGY